MFVGSVSLLPEINNQCLLTSSSAVVVNEAVDTKLIKEPNFIITDTSMCLLNQAIDALGKDAEVWLCGGNQACGREQQLSGVGRL